MSCSLNSLKGGYKRGVYKGLLSGLFRGILGVLRICAGIQGP